MMSAVRVVGAQWNVRLAFPNLCSADACAIDYGSVFAINFAMVFAATIACIVSLDKLQPHCSYLLMKSLLLQDAIEADTGKQPDSGDINRERMQLLLDERKRQLQSGFESMSRPSMNSMLYPSLNTEQRDAELKDFYPMHSLN